MVLTVYLLENIMVLNRFFGLSAHLTENTKPCKCCRHRIMVRELHFSENVIPIAMVALAARMELSQSCTVTHSHQL